MYKIIIACTVNYIYVYNYAMITFHRFRYPPILILYADVVIFISGMKEGIIIMHMSICTEYYKITRILLLIYKYQLVVIYICICSSTIIKLLNIQ